MDIAFQNRKLEKTFNTKTALLKAHGERMVRVIKRRMALLAEVPNLARVPTTPPNRRHQLSGDRNEQFAVDLVHPYRLVFKAQHDPPPRKDDGGIDVEQVTAITITEVADYHKKRKGT